MHEDRKADATLLVASVTGRALAQSARRGGYAVVVLDCFADLDTRAAALHARAVMEPRAIRLDRRNLLAAARALAPSAGLVYGSGFEGRLPLLRALAAGRRLHGNPAEVVKSVKDPARFFPLLDRLGIPHPEVRRVLPGSSKGWLAKRAGGAGGTHVHPAGQGRPAPGIYYQRLTPGEPHSVLFLADGKRSLVLGWNRQWTRPVPGAPFLFGGAVSGVRLAPRVQREVTEAVAALVGATGLVGLNGIDFLLDGDRWSLLEVNPRPPATAELYDPYYPRGLFHWHLAASAGRLPARARRSRVCRAFTIVPAPVNVVLGEQALPSWCRDRSGPGTAFRPGDPVCTVHASGATPSAARARVEERRRRIEALLTRQHAGAIA